MSGTERSSDLLAAFERYQRAAGLSPITADERTRIVRRCVGVLGHPLRLTLDDLAGWLADPEYARWTRATYYGALRAFYVWCVESGRLDRSPLTGMRRPRVPAAVPRPAPLDLVHRLIAGPEPWRTVTLLGVYAGLRAGEICRLRRQEVTAESIRVIEGKGGKTAEVPTHASIWEAVRDRPAGLLVTRVRGGAYQPQHLSGGFGTHVQTMGYQVTLHALRHRFGTEVYRSTRDLLLTQKLMRHASPTQTAGYAALVDSDRADAIRRLSF